MASTSEACKLEYQDLPGIPRKAPQEEYGHPLGNQCVPALGTQTHWPLVEELADFTQGKKVLCQVDGQV
jgi:hypothetical protein